MLDHKKRSDGWGASEIGAVAGLNPWRSPLHAIADKIDQRKNPRTDHNLSWGHRLEEPNAKHVMIVLGVDVSMNDECFIHEQDPICRATPDAFCWKAMDARNVLELKSTSVANHWKNSLDCPDGVPEYVYAQVIWQMGATGLRTNAFVSAIINGKEPAIYTVPWNQGIFDELLACGKVAWDFVLKEEIPPVSEPMPGADSYLRKNIKQTSDEIQLVEGREAAGLVKAMRAVNLGRDMVKMWTEHTDKHAAILKSRIGETDGITADDNMATWRANKAGNRALKIYLKEE